VLGSVGTVQAQAGERQNKSSSDEDLGPQLLAAAVWKESKLPGIWRQVSVQSAVQIRELAASQPVFGQRAENVQAFFREERLERIVVTYLEAGFFFADGTAKRRDFAVAFRQLEKNLPEVLAKVTKDRGHRVRQGQGSLSERATEFVRGNLSLRLLCEDDQLVSLTIQPTTEADRDYVAGELPSRQERRQNAAAKVERLDNGDVRIQGIPMSDQHDRGYCAVATLAMVMQYHGLTLDVDTLAAKAGYRQGEVENANVQGIYEEAARAGELRFSESSRFSLREVQRAIDRGEPVIVWRTFSRARDEFHSQFAARYAQDATAQLPDPRSKEGRVDRRQWPKRDNEPGHASVITGYNAQRHEILFTESWGETYRNRRMRVEEAEATTVVLFFFGL